MKKQHRIFNALLTLVVVICTAIMPAIAFAAESGSNFSKSESGTILAVDQLTGQSAASVDSLGGVNLRSNDVTAPQMSDMTLFYEDGKLVLKGSLTYNGKTVPFESRGDFYKNDCTERASTFRDLVLGEMSDFGNIHFVQLRIDKQEPKLSIFLQDKDSKQILYFEMPIGNDTFNQIDSLPNNQLNGTELEEKIVHLYSVSGNLINPPSTEGESGSSSPADSTNDIKARSTSYSGWKHLIDNLNAHGSVVLSNYSGINASMFKGGGWHYDYQWGNTPCAFVSDSVANGSNFYLTQFSLIDIVEQSNRGSANDLWNTSIQAMYNDGAVVEYDKYTDRLSVKYYHFGVSFNNFEVGINGLTNQGVFINRSVNRSYESGGNVVRAAISVYNPAAAVAGIFEHLMPYTDQNINNTVLFDETYSKQYARYGGKTIRGIAASTSNKRLTRPGHYINVGGKIRYNPTLGTKWDYGYQYKCNSSL